MTPFLRLSGERRLDLSDQTSFHTGYSPLTAQGYSHIAVFESYFFPDEMSSASMIFSKLDVNQYHFSCAAKMAPLPEQWTQTTRSCILSW
jgi:hypothetical protein